MKMGMKPGVIPEDMDHHDHAQDAVIEAQHCAEKHLQVLLGGVAQLRQEFPVVLEIDAQHDGNAEHKLSMGNWIEDGVEDVFPELNLGRGGVDGSRELAERQRRLGRIFAAPSVASTAPEKPPACASRIPKSEPRIARRSGMSTRVPGVVFGVPPRTSSHKLLPARNAKQSE
jgi:hypothetical protein